MARYYFIGNAIRTLLTVVQLVVPIVAHAAAEFVCPGPGCPERASVKDGTVAYYDKSSREVIIKGKDWVQRAKVTSKDADDKKDLLKADAKVKVEFDDRGGGDVRVKSISPR